MSIVNLMYHDVVAGSDSDLTGFTEPGADHYKIDRNIFSAHLRAIASCLDGHGRVGLIQELDSALPPDVTITFDDGGVGAMAAVECLAEHGWKGHFLIATSFVGQPGFLSKSDLREILDCGHVIGSHSHTHISNMKSRPKDTVLNEWSISLRSLEDLLGSKVDVASVPYGAYSPFVATLAAQAGVRYLFTSEPTTRPAEVDSVTVLGRYSVTRNSTSSDVAALIENRRLKRQHQWLSWNSRKMTKAVLGPGYSLVRRLLRPT